MDSDENYDSDKSGLSDRNDDHSVGRTVAKLNSSNRATLTRMEMKQRKNVEDGDDEYDDNDDNDGDTVDDNYDDDDESDDDQEAPDPEFIMMKERFAKLLLGEDMSGGGKGVCTAVTVSNAITNLYATVFGQSLRLQPLSPEKKALWRREMNCFLSICDYIVEIIPRSNASNVEVMETRLRSDILMNLPALKKLDMMLMEILDSFDCNEFWYAERGSASMKSPSSGSESFRNVPVQRKDEKWWLPVACVPPEGLSENSRKHLMHKRDCASQIHKAALAINDSVLGEMDIPDSYVVTLPKSGKASIGDATYKNMATSDKFYPEHLLDNLKIKSEHEALELADKVEASLCTWKRKSGGFNHYSRSSWDLTRDFEEAGNDRNDKNHVLAARAKSLLFCLKQRFPELSQTSLDICKIQYNRDVGKAVLESYSRVLEGLAYNIVSWVDDVLHVDNSLRDQAD